jgi:hypothetical protein
MSREFRAISIVVALVAIAVVVISHRRHADRITSFAQVQVLVARKTIQKGTPGDVIRSDPALYSVVAVQPTQAANGAIVDPATLIGKVAVTDIAQGQQITAADFDPAAMNGPSFGHGSERAVVVSSPKEIGGPIAAGSHVDVLVVTNKQGKFRELSRNLLVLDVEHHQVTVRATVQQAGKLIHAMQHGGLVVRR